MHSARNLILCDEEHEESLVFIKAKLLRAVNDFAAMFATLYSPVKGAVDWILEIVGREEEVLYKMAELAQKRMQMDINDINAGEHAD